MNIAFFGTDEFSVRVLETLKELGLKPSLIITVPDQPQGRKMIVTPPPAKVWAESNGINVAQPLNLKEDKELAIFDKALASYDLFLVASYGKIIPQNILDLPANGVLNIHPSLLPKYRGSSPLETAILNGDQETGVTIIKLDSLMDHGPIIAADKIKQNDNYNFEQLRDELATRGAKLFYQILPQYLNGEIIPQEQDHEQATLTKKFTKEDGYLDPQTPAIVRYRKILALNPWPGTFFDYPAPQGKIRLIVKKAHLEEDKLIYDRVVPAGRKEMSWNDFLLGLGPKK